MLCYLLPSEKIVLKMSNANNPNERSFLITSVKNGVRTIKFNRPEKKNAFGPGSYILLAKILNEDANNKDVVVTVLTGIGDFYSSGNELNPSLIDSEEALQKATTNVLDLVAAFIDYPKLLIAVVNGPAIGVAVTLLALCDVAYASDKATFSTPFINLGLCAEGCSSYLFQRIMGKSKASEVLLMGHKMSAQEAYQFGLISKVIPHNELDDLFKKLQGYGKLSPNVVMRTKRLMTNNLKNVLHETNKLEMQALLECFQSEELWEAMANFLSRKSKL